MDAVAAQVGALVEAVLGAVRRSEHAEDVEDLALLGRPAGRELEQDRLRDPPRSEAVEIGLDAPLEARATRRRGDDDLRPLGCSDQGRERAAVDGVQPNASPPPAGEHERKRDESRPLSGEHDGRQAGRADGDVGEPGAVQPRDVRRRDAHAKRRQQQVVRRHVAEGAGQGTTRPLS